MTGDDGKAIFRVRDLTKTYRAGDVDVFALRGVGVTIIEGEMAVLLGPSGSGKSTFLNIMGGLDQASSGQILFRDLDLGTCSERQLTRYRRDHVGFIFQFYNLISSLTAYENVSLVTEIARNPMRPEEALDMVGLKDRMHHFPAQLSGGEQQRVAIARAIVKRPEVLLCDEPTGALDVKTGILVLDALSRINQEFKATTILITHNAAIGQIAHRVFTFRDGRIETAAENARRLAPSDMSW